MKVLRYCVMIIAFVSLVSCSGPSKQQRINDAIDYYRYKCRMDSIHGHAMPFSLEDRMKHGDKLFAKEYIILYSDLSIREETKDIIGTPLYFTEKIACCSFSHKLDVERKQHIAKYRLQAGTGGIIKEVWSLVGVDWNF